jgi:hypothetical protein
MRAECPEHYAHLWDWFRELHRFERLQTPGGPMAISAAQVNAWASLRGTGLTPHEFRVIRMLDAVYLGVRYGN